MSGAPALAPADGLDTSKVLALANALRIERRLDAAVVLFEHLLALDPADEGAMGGLVLALGAAGRTLEALHRLMAMKRLRPDLDTLLSMIREQSLPAVAKYNAHLEAGEIEEAERYAAALADLVPRGEPMLSAALTCNLALGRAEEAARYARALLDVDPDHAAARAVLAQATPIAPAASEHPLVRLRDLHDAASAILCRPLDLEAAAEAERLRQAGLAVRVDAPDGSEWKAWELHYRMLLEAIDLPAVFAPTPEALPEPELAFADAAGAPLDGWPAIRARAETLGARCIFFAAADEAYVELYARWYALSVLKYCDVPCLVVIHVIGGAGRLGEVAGKVGIDDERLAFSADGFDIAAVTTRCYDAPPKGEASKPLAHLQSVRFLRLGALMAQLERPVFVSDIDLLLQRGVADLMERCAGADLGLNENDFSPNAGSRLTANLLLANPTPNAATFVRFLSNYLARMLARPQVTRWIDQLALVMARQHLQVHGQAGGLAYFDTASDINNVMYPSYHAEHPFRFLSLFHGFDTSSLENNPRVLGEAATPAPRRKAKKAMAK
jgi:tetratricopeptide (TPR) repeat protein